MDNKIAYKLLTANRKFNGFSLNVVILSPHSLWMRKPQQHDTTDLLHNSINSNSSHSIA